MAKGPPYTGVETLCTGKQDPIYGHEDTLHLPKDPHVWAWGQFVVAKRAPYMVIGTLCTGKKTCIYGHGSTLRRPKDPHIWLADILH